MVGRWGSLHPTRVQERRSLTCRSREHKSETRNSWPAPTGVQTLLRSVDPVAQRRGFHPARFGREARKASKFCFKIRDWGAEDRPPGTRPLVPGLQDRSGGGGAPDGQTGVGNSWLRHAKEGIDAPGIASHSDPGRWRLVERIVRKAQMHGRRVNDGRAVGRTQLELVAWVGQFAFSWRNDSVQNFNRQFSAAGREHCGNNDE